MGGGEVEEVREVLGEVLREADLDWELRYLSQPRRTPPNFIDE